MPKKRTRSSSAHEFLWRGRGWSGWEQATRCLPLAPGGLPLARPPEDELAVLDLPLEGLALGNPQGLGEGAGYRDEEHALRVLLDADAVGHGTFVFTCLLIYL